MKYRGLSAIDAGAVENCARQVASLSTKVHDVLLRSNEKDGWLFRTSLAALQSVRQNIDTTHDDNTKRVLDGFALQLSQATEGRLSSDPALINTFREMTYIQYASKLGADAGRLQGHYSKVEKKDVFPSHFTFTFGGTDERTGITYNIHYRSPLSAEEMARLKQELVNTHSRLERVHGGIPDHLEGEKFDLYIFDSQQEYETYGSLWGVNTAAGGYAHMRRFRADDVYTRYDLNPDATSHFIRTEAFVAKRPGLDLPRNFGHEAVHLMTYGLVGQAGMQHLPSWFVEGMANSLGNPDCLEEEIGYIARYQGQGRAFPTVAKILTMNYGNGADLYYFGSRLFSYCLEKKPEFTWNLLEAAKKGDKAAVADLLKQLEETPRVSEEFHQWLSELVTTCKTAPPSAGRATTLAAGAVATVAIPSLLTTASRAAIEQGSQFTRKMLADTSSPTKAPATDNNMTLWIVLAVGIAVAVIGAVAAVLACKFCGKQRRLPSGNNPEQRQEAGKSGVAKPLLKPVDYAGVEMMVRSMEQQQTPFLQRSATAGPQNKVGSTCAIS